MGYRVAGKTGTSEKKAKELSTGIKGLRISSFVAFAPADAPADRCAHLCLTNPMSTPLRAVLLRRQSSAALWKTSCLILKLNRFIQKKRWQSRISPFPKVTGYSRAGAEQALKQNGISYRIEGEGDMVTDQIPGAGAVVSSKAQVILYMGGAKPDKMVTVPDLSGMSVEKARTTLSNINLYLRATGAAKSSTGGNIAAIKQDVEYGTQVPVGTVITVDFSDLDQRAE